jgi:hypothetical protein
MLDKPDYPTIARIGHQLLERVDLKGGEVQAFMVVQNMLADIIDGRLVVVAVGSGGGSEVGPESTPETPENSPA